MSIVHMFGFDQMPDRAGVTREHMAAEGFDIMTPNVTVNAGQWNISRINGRAWMSAVHLYYANTTSLVTRRSALIYGRTLADLFGNPAKLKTGVLGARIYVDPLFATRAAAHPTDILQINSVTADVGLPIRLTQGEHFIEFEFDFAAYTVKTYLNSSLIGTFQVPYNQLTGATVFQFGLQSTSAQNLSTVALISFTDIYVTHDNEDGGVSGRLGPVKVLPLSVDKIDRPANWGYSDADAFYAYPDYDIGEGVTATYNGHLLIPRYTDTNDVAGQFKYESTPPAAAQANGARFNPPGGVADSWYVSNANTAIAHLFTFARAKKVTAYVLGSYNPNYGAFDDWTFEGSNDGAVWSVLDTRTGMGIKFNAGLGRTYAFKITPGKVGTYRYYRIAVTKSVIGSSSTTRVYMNHMQLLGDPADAAENGMLDAVNRVPFSALADMDYPVIRTGIDGSESTFGFTVPEFGTSQVLGVKVGISGRRDQGSSEHIRAKLKVGESAGTEKVFELKPHTERVEMFPMAVTAPDGSTWSKESLENLRVVVKSKSGAK